MGLPCESALRSGSRPDLVEHLDQWMRAILEFWTAKPNQRIQLPAPPGDPWLTPASQPREEPETTPTRIDTNDPNQIADFYKGLVSG